MSTPSGSVVRRLFLLLTALPCLSNAQTAVTLSTSPNPSIFGAPVVLTATVTPATATGRVTFYDGVTVLGTKSLISGAAQISTIALPAGSRKLRAYYAGANTPATSNVVTQNVHSQPSAGFSTASPPVTAFGLLAVADFNGDGKADIAAMNLTGGTSGLLTVLLGDGAGGFSAASTTIQGFPRVAAVGDFNGDGIPDLAVPLGANLGILLGKGDGTFQLVATSLPLNPSSSLPSVAAGDFNGDGLADVVLADPSTGVYILLGKGDGTFQPAVPYSTNPQTGNFIQANFVLVGDFNGDGKADLATLNAGSANLSILPGNGDGTFQASSVTALPAPAASLTVSDFNGDGKADVATNTGAILLGNGDGTFRQPVTYPSGSSSYVGVGDLNGDGNTDLVFSGGQAVTVLSGKGDGTFQSPVTYLSGFPALVGEFNGDGKTDLAVLTGSALNLLLGTTVTVMPSGGALQSTPKGTPFPSPLQVTVKDGTNPISGIAVTFTAPSSGPSAVLSSTVAMTDANGVASVTATANSVTGSSYTVTATALGVPALFALTNLAGPPSVLTATGTPQSTVVGTAFPKPLQVTLTDSSGLFVTGAPVTFTAPTSGASAVLSAGTVSTDAFGTASVMATANNIPGTYTVTARFGTLSATFTLTNLQPATVTLSSSVNPSTFGAPLTLTATVSGAPSTGRVTFFDGVNILGTKPVTSGAASISTILLSAGSHKLTAYYRDDVNFVAGTSNALAQTVRAVAGAALAAQTPIALPTVPINAAVGDFNGDGKADFAYSGSSNVTSWWQVDLGASAGIGSITIWNRTDCCGDRLTDYWVFVSNTPFSAVDSPATLQNRAGTFSSHQTTAPQPSTAIPVNAQGRYVRVQLTNPNYLSLAEVQVFGTGAQLGTNLALGKAASQSSTLPGYPTAAAASAVDGNTDGSFVDGSVSTTGIVSGAIVSVALGRGDGTFQPPVSYAAEVSGWVAVGDFNGDGISDLAVGGTTVTTGNPVAGLSVLPGNGDGTFGPEVTYTGGFLTGGGPLVVGDFNGDGKADILMGSVSFNCHLCSFAQIILVPGNGDGTFAAPVTYSVGGSSNGPSPIAVADFNADGIPDAVISSSVLLGNGDGTHQAPIAFNVAGTSTSYVTGDFNGDGKIDLAIGGATFPSGVLTPTTWILLGNGDGTFLPPVSYPGTAVTSGDFNGDGLTDLVVADSSGNTSGLLLGNGDGTFHQGFAIPAGAPLAVADFNGDGRADILTTSASGVTVLLGVASASISVTATGGTPQNTSISSPFAVPLQVKVLNNGAPVTGATMTFTVPTVGASAVLSSSTAQTNASGVASVTATANSVAGSYVVTASYNGMTASFSLTNTVYAFIVATGGTPQSAAVGTAFPTALQATVKNTLGGGVSGVTVNFSVPTVGASATLSSATAVTNASGVASVTATANSIAGAYSVTATVGTLSASFSLTNVTGGGGSSNLAVGKTATQSSTFPGVPTAVASSAIDGNTDGTFSDGSVTATNLDANPWWQVDLGASATVSSVAIWNRTDCCGSRLSDYWVFISDTPFLATDTPATLQNRAGTFASHQTSAPNPSATIPTVVHPCPPAALCPDFLVQGRYLRVQLSSANYLSLAEVQVFGTGAPSVSNLSQGKAATQSSTLPGVASAAASSAVDGNTDGAFFDGSVTATNLDPNPWWQVDLGASASVSSVVIFNRTDCCGTRLTDYWVFVSDTPFLATDTPATLQNRPGTFASHQTSVPNPSTTIAASAQGRYVRVQLSNANYLSLAEVQVFGTGGAPPPADLAQGKQATQSSTLPGAPTAVAASAVDGNTDGNFFDGSVTATNLDANPWWQVDLGASAAVSSVVVFNRTDCCGTRLSDYWVFVSDTPFLATDTPATLQNRAGTFASHQTTAPNPSTTILAGAQGRYVRVQLSGANYLSLAEVQVFGQ